MSKFLKIIIIIFMCCDAYGLEQVQYLEKRLKVSDIGEFENGYLIAGIDLINNDTIYFISLKGNTCKNQNERIKVGYEYIFEIEDMDYIKGGLPTALPNGYYIKRGGIYIEREGREGKTYTTTQYLSKNTIGVFLIERGR